MILTMHLQMVMKRTVLGPSWLTKRMNAVRFGVITQCGRLLTHARQHVLRVSQAFAVDLRVWRANLDALRKAPA